MTFGEEILWVAEDQSFVLTADGFCPLSGEQ
ncbi:hypothetical protein V1289_008565 [Bradyrhizobium sp. AZCC 2289]